MVDGEQPYDLSAECAPTRYGANWASDGFAAAKIAETYAHNNRVSYPHENRPAGRTDVYGDARAGARALRDALVARGGVLAFSATSGVETPLYYAEPGSAAASPPPEAFHTFANHIWADAAIAEARHVLDGVGISHASFSKLRVGSGASAAATELLEHCTTNRVPKVAGGVRLTYLPTASGKLHGECTVARVGGKGEHEYYVVGGRDAAPHDLAWLRARRAALFGADAGDETVALSDASDAVEILHIAGPRSLALLSAIEPSIADVGFLKCAELSLLGVLARVIRVSFTGEQGFELHVAAEDAAALYDAIWAHPAAAREGLRAFGSAAVNSLRMEKGFCVKADLDYAHWTEAGIEPFVALERPKAAHEFLGRHSAPPGAAPRRAALFEVATAPGFEWSVPSDCPVRDARGALVGFTTSCAHGAETGKTLAKGFVLCDASAAGGAPPVPLAAPGDAGLVVECYGESWPVLVLERPPVGVRGMPAKGSAPGAVAPSRIAAAPRA